MTTLRPIYDRNGRLDRFVPGNHYEPGHGPGDFTWLPTPPSASRVPPLLIVLVLALAIAATTIAIVRNQSEQPAARLLQLNNPSPRLTASAGVVVYSADFGQ